LMKWPMAILPLVVAILSVGASAVEPALRRIAEAGTACRSAPLFRWLSNV
jgi:hypothetical protein